MGIYTDIMSWHQMILDQASSLGEEVECSIPSLDDAAMTRTFDCGYGSTNGKPFVAFTENFVLFPALRTTRSRINIKQHQPIL